MQTGHGLHVILSNLIVMYLWARGKAPVMPPTGVHEWLCPGLASPSELTALRGSHKRGSSISDGLVPLQAWVSAALPGPAGLSLGRCRPLCLGKPLASCAAGGLGPASGGDASALRPELGWVCPGSS